MSCNLSLMGKLFNIDDFLEKSKLTGYSKSYMGELSFPNSKIKKINKFSSLSKEISKDSWLDFNKQVDDVFNYLSKNEKKLKSIKETPEIEFANLSFGITSEINSIILVKSYYIPLKLINLLAELGITVEISLYNEEMDNILNEKYGRK